MEIGLAARSCVLRQSKNRLLQAIFPLSQGQFWIVASPFLQCRKALQNCRKSHFRPFLGERLHRLWYVPQFETEVKKTQLVFPQEPNLKLQNAHAAEFGQEWTEMIDGRFVGGAV